GRWNRERPARVNEFAEVGSLDVLHGEGQEALERRRAVGADDIGMIEARRSAHFAFEALERSSALDDRRGDDFERLQPVPAPVPHQVYNPPAPAIELADDFVVRALG